MCKGEGTYLMLPALLDASTCMSDASSLALLAGLARHIAASGADSTRIHRPHFHICRRPWQAFPPRSLYCLRCCCRRSPFASIDNIKKTFTYLLLGATRSFLLVAPLHLADRARRSFSRLPCRSLVKVPHEREQGQPRGPLVGRSRLHWWWRRWSLHRRGGCWWWRRWWRSRRGSGRWVVCWWCSQQRQRDQNIKTAMRRRAGAARLTCD